MSATCSITSGGDKWYARDRLGGLRRFAIAITVLNILGHTVFGFEQSYAQPLVSLATAYSMEVLMELFDCWANRRRPKFLCGGWTTIDFFLPAHISGLAVAMLLYANDRFAPVMLAAAIAIASKAVFRVPINGQVRHFFNPSNFGITITLLLFPWVGIAPPYHFTENMTGYGDWVLPGVIVCTGSLLNTCYTRRLPLIMAWLGTFLLQAVLRHFILGSSLSAALMPMTGVAFLLYTFYMVTDPPTTPSSTRGQIAFGASVAAVYGLLMTSHIVFGLFFALTAVSTVRGIYLYAMTLAGRNTVAAARPAMAAAANGATLHGANGHAAPVGASVGGPTR